MDRLWVWPIWWHTCCPDRGWERAGRSAARSSRVGSGTLVPGPRRAGRCHERSRASCRARSPVPRRASSGSWWSPAARCWCTSSGYSRGNWSRSGSARDGKCPSERPPACLEAEREERRFMCRRRRASRLTHTHTHKQQTRGWYESNGRREFQTRVSAVTVRLIKTFYKQTPLDFPNLHQHHMTSSLKHRRGKANKKRMEKCLLGDGTSEE